MDGAGWKPIFDHLHIPLLCQFYDVVKFKRLKAHLLRCCSRNSLYPLCLNLFSWRMKKGRYIKLCARTAMCLSYCLLYLKYSYFHQIVQVIFFNSYNDLTISKLKTMAFGMFGMFLMKIKFRANIEFIII